MATIIRSTMNYHWFNLLTLNRPIRESKVKEIAESMKKYGWIDAFPAMVEEVKGANNFYIKCGNHRFLAAQKANVPVKYVICKEGIPIHEIEKPGVGQWTVNDYLQHYSHLGLENYTYLSKYIKMTGVPPNVAISLCAGKASNNKSLAEFKSGEYKLGDQFLSTNVAYIVIELKKAGIPFVTKQAFVQALARVLYVDDFDTVYFCKKAKKNKAFMEPQRNHFDYLEMIDLIYNRGATKRIPLAFLANEAARERCAVKSTT